MFRFRILVVCIRFLGRRRRWLVPLSLWMLLSIVTVWWLGEAAGRALAVPEPPTQHLHHYQRSTDLQHYLDHIQLLIEPSSVCESAPRVLALVSSAPTRADHRQAIRASWALHLPTYFVLGLDQDHIDSDLVDIYIEARQYSDIIVYDFRDHYQNLTLKSVLMLHWTLQRCPGVDYLFKTDDDVVVNPWTLATVMDEHPGADLLGYSRNGSWVHRDPYNKWFVPRWLRLPDYLPAYLSGTGYLVAGRHLETILSAAKSVPLINLEDVYLTYLVSSSKLHLQLTHDRRLSPYKPWIGLDCAFWNLASIHSFDAYGIEQAWAKIHRVSKENKDVCSFYKKFIDSEYLLY